MSAQSSHERSCTETHNQTRKALGQDDPAALKIERQIETYLYIIARNAKQARADAPMRSGLPPEPTCPVCGAQFLIRTVPNTPDLVYCEWCDEPAPLPDRETFAGVGVTAYQPRSC
jgi:hypothetical protein